MSASTKADGFVAVLTGAGISAESGVPTFRGDGGLWRSYQAQDLATPYAFRSDPQLVWEWYNWRRGLIGACLPNTAHSTLVQMERIFDEFLLITQNVDGIHHLAGSRQIVELHGNIWRMRCTGNCQPAWEDRRSHCRTFRHAVLPVGLWPGPTWSGLASRCRKGNWTLHSRQRSTAT